MLGWCLAMPPSLALEQRGGEEVTLTGQQPIRVPWGAQAARGFITLAIKPHFDPENS